MGCGRHHPHVEAGRVGFLLGSAGTGRIAGCVVKHELDAQLSPPRGHPDARRTDIADRAAAAARLATEPGWEYVAVVVMDKATRYARRLAADETDAEFRRIVGVS